MQYYQQIILDQILKTVAIFMTPTTATEQCTMTIAVQSIKREITVKAYALLELPPCHTNSPLIIVKIGHLSSHSL